MATMTIPTIAALALAERIRAGRDVCLVDVRTPAEYRAVHARAARNVPLEQLTPDALPTSSADETVYVICDSGTRAMLACEQLQAAGCMNVVCVEGGTKAWEAAGLTVVRGKGMISLERQVRIVAGSVVLTGAVLAIAVNPWFALVSAFIGAGLMHAGVTDTCGLAWVLARMPWNCEACAE